MQVIVLNSSVKVTTRNLISQGKLTEQVRTFVLSRKPSTRHIGSKLNVALITCCSFVVDRDLLHLLDGGFSFEEKKMNL